MPTSGPTKDRDNRRAGGWYPPLPDLFCITNKKAPLVARGDSPQCGEMSRSDRGDGHRLGAVAFMRLRG